MPEPCYLQVVPRIFLGYHIAVWVICWLVILWFVRPEGWLKQLNAVGWMRHDSTPKSSELGAAYSDGSLSRTGSSSDP
jgi:hypothetical protein